MKVQSLQIYPGMQNACNYMMVMKQAGSWNHS